MGGQFPPDPHTTGTTEPLGKQTNKQTNKQKNRPEARTDARDRTRKQTKDNTRARGHESTDGRRRVKSGQTSRCTSGAPHTSATPAGPRADFGLGPCLQGSSSCAGRTRRNRAAGADRPPDLDTSKANNPRGHPPEAPVANAPRCGARWCQRARRASCGFSRRCTARRAAERRCSSSASPRTTT